MSGERLRRLPWDGPEGKPAMIPDGNPDGPLSRLADFIEAQQLDTADTVLGLALGVLDSGKLGKDELAYVARRLAECLTDVLRVARSRGERLPSNPLPLDGPLPGLLRQQVGDASRRTAG
ncbi:MULTISPECIES: hypothetical protein [Streptomyces]|uniref:Uncharacterized protein n=1 Tax=Streptomyces fradiae TaxID=1906 RepID=A0ACC4WDS5_STRFR|nr:MULTISPECIES: hypothetical protein [Streptomyces]KNE82650.1 hypothetical protein ADZ36_09425 [Streptomyces fradiae]OFA52369.1 hypothetical protein BEN35_11970 [Streptomyces fradiae]